MKDKYIGHAASIYRTRHIYISDAQYLYIQRHRYMTLKEQDLPENYIACYE